MSRPGWRWRCDGGRQEARGKRGEGLDEGGAFFDGGGDGFDVFGAEEAEMIQQRVELVDGFAVVVVVGGKFVNLLVGGHEGGVDRVEELQVGDFGFGVGVFAVGV